MFLVYVRSQKILMQNMGSLKTSRYNVST